MRLEEILDSLELSTKVAPLDMDNLFGSLALETAAKGPTREDPFVSINPGRLSKDVKDRMLSPVMDWIKQNALKSINLNSDLPTWSQTRKPGGIDIFNADKWVDKFFKDPHGWGILKRQLEENFAKATKASSVKPMTAASELQFKEYLTDQLYEDAGHGMTTYTSYVVKLLLFIVPTIRKIAEASLYEGVKRPNTYKKITPARAVKWLEDAEKDKDFVKYVNIVRSRGATIGVKDFLKPILISPKAVAESSGDDEEDNTVATPPKKIANKGELPPGSAPPTTRPSTIEDELNKLDAVGRPIRHMPNIVDAAKKMAADRATSVATAPSKKVVITQLNAIVAGMVKVGAAASVAKEKIKVSSVAKLKAAPFGSTAATARAYYLNELYKLQVAKGVADVPKPKTVNYSSFANMTKWIDNANRGQPLWSELSRATGMVESIGPMLDYLSLATRKIPKMPKKDPATAAHAGHVAAVVSDLIGLFSGLGGDQASKEAIEKSNAACVTWSEQLRPTKKGSDVQGTAPASTADGVPMSYDELSEDQKTRVNEMMDRFSTADDRKSSEISISDLQDRRKSIISKLWKLPSFHEAGAGSHAAIKQAEGAPADPAVDKKPRGKKTTTVKTKAKGGKKAADKKAPAKKPAKKAAKKPAAKTTKKAAAKKTVKKAAAKKTTKKTAKKAASKTAAKKKASSKSPAKKKKKAA